MISLTKYLNINLSPIMSLITKMSECQACHRLGLSPVTADFVESFYLPKFDIMCHAPVFVAFIDCDQEVILSPEEHNEFQWVSLSEALSLLEFSGQRAALQHIDDQFIKKTPNNRFMLTPNVSKQ